MLLIFFLEIISNPTVQQQPPKEGHCSQLLYRRLDPLNNRRSRTSRSSSHHRSAAVALALAWPPWLEPQTPLNFFPSPPSHTSFTTFLSQQSAHSKYEILCINQELHCFIDCSANNCLSRKALSTNPPTELPNPAASQPSNPVVAACAPFQLRQLMSFVSTIPCFQFNFSYNRLSTTILAIPIYNTTHPFTHKLSLACLCR